MRGDDAVGSLIAERLLPCTNEQLLVIDAETTPENYLGTLLSAHPEVVLFVDALDFGGKGGQWVLVPLSELAPKLPSTHTVSLRLLGEILANEKIECWLLGIQPEHLVFGMPLSRSVLLTALELADFLAGVVGEVSGDG